MHARPQWQDASYPAAKSMAIGPRSSVRFDYEHDYENEYDSRDIYRPFGSRFAFNCSSVTVEATPSRGTSILAVHRMAFSTSLRKSSLPQFLWTCAPVKPNDRPPLARCVAQAAVSLFGLSLGAWR